MKNYISAKIILPKELERSFFVSKVIALRESGSIYELTKKSNYKETRILKIIPAEYFSQALYEKILSIPTASLLLPLEEYHTGYFIFFLFPVLSPLSEFIKQNRINMKQIKNLAEDLGKTLIALHEQYIFHMDISPGNIYVTPESRFLLGDFSSSVFSPPDAKKRSGTGRQKRTGSTPGFFPENITRKHSYNYDIFDIYGYSKLLSLLLRNGNFPGKEDLNALFEKAVKNCELQITDKHSLPGLLTQAFVLFSEIEKSEDLSTCRITIPEFENPLFSSVTMPLKNNYSDRVKQFFSSFKSDVFSKKEKKEVSFLQHSKTTQKGKNTSAYRYGLLILCGFLFLFSVYHTISITDKSHSPRKQFVSEKEEIPVSPVPDSSSPVVSLPVKTSPPVPKAPKSEETVLDIAHQRLHSASFAKGITNKGEISIIFAEGNSFKKFDSFLSFSHLKELYLSQNNLYSVKGISSLNSLEILDLSNNHLSDLSELSELKKLKILDLSGQKSLTNTYILKKMKSLRYLILTNTNLSKAEGVEIKKSLPECLILY